MAGGFGTCPYCSKELKSEGKFCPYCGNRVPAGESRTGFIGRTIGGHYKITEKLGEGGMGYVFKARHTLLDKDVAIKVLREDFADNPEAFERFRREAKNTSRLSHPNAVSMYDFGQTDDGLVYIILEYIEGCDLRMVLDKEQYIPEKRAISIFKQICDVLHEAHKQNIIHRDLKSENIMLKLCDDKRDFVKVLDFGIAKLMNVGGKITGGTLTQKGVVFGTPQYMCPEQVKGEQMDQRSDIYSLGIIMYEVLCGEVPFMANNPVDIMVMQVKEKPATLKKYRNISISADIEKIIMKCLEKKPQHRYQSIQELRSSLGLLLEGGDSLDSRTSAEASYRREESTVEERSSLSKKPVYAKPNFRLVNINGLDTDSTQVFKSETVKIGRHSSNDVVVKLAQVSKFHAEVHFKDGQYVLVDRGSLNGSYVNSKQIQAQVIKQGDLLEFSRRNGLKVRFEIVDED